MGKLHEIMCGKNWPDQVICVFLLGRFRYAEGGARKGVGEGHPPTPYQVAVVENVLGKTRSVALGRVDLRAPSLPPSF